MFNEKVWRNGELEAIKYMKKCGYKIITTNFTGKGFELDIVAKLHKKKLLKQLRVDFKEKLKKAVSYEDVQSIRNVFLNQKKELKHLLIITEVKARTNNKYGKGFDAVSATKQEKLVLGAKWLLGQRKYQNFNVRFDVASIDGDKLSYIEGAFEAKNQ